MNRIPDHTEESSTRSPEDERRLRTRYLRLKSALYDRITGLYSYHLHLEHLQMECEARRLGVIVLEFPTLARLETAHGWEMGDRFLSGVGALLGAARGRLLPESSLLSLDGVYGDSFLIFVPEVADGHPDSGGLETLTGTLSRHLRSRLEQADWGPGPPALDFSLGHAAVSANPASRFERRLHQAIREARAMTARRAARLQDDRAGELRSILQGRRLTTHYQPIVDMERGTIMGYEALTRGPRDSSLEVPEALFACAESEHLSLELDSLCRHEALRNARGLDAGLKLFLNALPETLRSPNYADAGLPGILAEMALRPSNLVLEITERCAIADFEAFCSALGRLRRQGYLVAIDDVGTGYSSLQSITEVQPDFLKIDISLIKKIHQSLIKQELVQSLLQVGARIGAQVIAEGIETAEEHRVLRSCGVRYGQGFYFARPAPAFPTKLTGGRGPV